MVTKSLTFGGSGYSAQTNQSHSISASVDITYRVYCPHASVTPEISSLKLTRSITAQDRCFNAGMFKDEKRFDVVAVNKGRQLDTWHVPLIIAVSMIRLDSCCASKL